MGGRGPVGLAGDLESNAPSPRAAAQDAGPPPPPPPAVCDNTCCPGRGLVVQVPCLVWTQVPASPKKAGFREFLLWLSGNESNW